jgi:hypothetical protein
VDGQQAADANGRAANPSAGLSPGRINKQLIDTIDASLEGAHKTISS